MLNGNALASEGEKGDQKDGMKEGRVNCRGKMDWLIGKTTRGKKATWKKVIGLLIFLSIDN